MTGVAALVPAGGEGSTWAPFRCSSKPKHQGPMPDPWDCCDRGAVARHGSRFTRWFEDTIGWLATATSKTAVTELMRIGWRTVGGIVERIQVEIDGQVDRLAGLKRIGIDEISYKRGHKYLTIVVDHDSGVVVGGGRPGRGNGQQVLRVARGTTLRRDHPRFG